jgi:hypothetical protein
MRCPVFVRHIDVFAALGLDQVVRIIIEHHYEVGFIVSEV